MPEPTSDELDDILLSCRYGELEEVQAFLSTYTAEPLATLVDERGNTVLHMICGNGHVELLDLLLPLLPPTLLTHPNAAGSLPLHWATLNSHLPIVQKLVQDPRVDGPAMIDAKDGAGRTPLGEAEAEGWEEGARWLVGAMRVGEGKMKAQEGEAAAEDGEEGKEAKEGEELGGKDSGVEVGMADLKLEDEPSSAAPPRT